MMMQSTITASHSQRVSKSLLETAAACISWLHHTQSRNTVIVERKYPVNLYNKDGHPRLKAKNYIYKMVDRVDSHPVPKIECLLTDYVDGIGTAGEVVTVKRQQFRNWLSPAGLAVYPTKEALDEMDPHRETLVEEKSKLSPYVMMTARQLSGMNLRIPMSGDNAWVLNKTHIKVALRKMGVELTEDVITLPEDAVAEPQDIVFGVTVSTDVEVKVRGTIYHTYKDQSKNELLQDLPKVWGHPPILTEEDINSLKDS